MGFTSIGLRFGETATGTTLAGIYADGYDPAAAAGYDPTGDTVDGVLGYIADHPGERDAVLSAERAGKARKGILGD